MAPGQRHSEFGTWNWSGYDSVILRFCWTRLVALDWGLARDCFACG